MTGHIDSNNGEPIMHRQHERVYNILSQIVVFNGSFLPARLNVISYSEPVVSFVWGKIEVYRRTVELIANMSDDELARDIVSAVNWCVVGGGVV